MAVSFVERELMQTFLLFVLRDDDAMLVAALFEEGQEQTDSSMLTEVDVDERSASAVTVCGRDKQRRR